MIDIDGILYELRVKSDAQLIEHDEDENLLTLDGESASKLKYPIGARNGGGIYVLNDVSSDWYLNFVAQKVVISDRDIREFLNPTFEYFIEPEPPEPEKFTLPEGAIYRCVTLNSIPLPKEQYQYYIIVNGVGHKIPNYKTLEVMLAERNQTLLSVRVLEETQCADIPVSDEPVPDKSNVWTEKYKDITTRDALIELENSAKAAAQIANAAKQQAESQISAVQAQAEAARAEAEAAKADAEAARAEAEAAKAEAEAKIAEMEASSGE